MSLELVPVTSAEEYSMLASSLNSLAGEVESEQLANRASETLVNPLSSVNFFLFITINIFLILFFINVAIEIATKTVKMMFLVYLNFLSGTNCSV